MKKTTKVTLISLLIFPGAGHLILKSYLVAFGFIASVIYILIGFIKDVHDKSQQVIESIIQGEVPMETSAITQALIEHGVLDNTNLSIIGYLLVIIWLIAAFDAYRLAKKEMIASKKDKLIV
ncbi:MAG: hypothetical protein V5789_00380 [Colwellia sp.]